MEAFGTQESTHKQPGNAHEAEDERGIFYFTPGFGLSSKGKDQGQKNKEEHGHKRPEASDAIFAKGKNAKEEKRHYRERQYVYFF